MKYFIKIVGVLKLFIAKMISRNLKINDIWLICEKPNEARDNGYYFFKYCVEQKKRNNVFYVIDKDSYDLTNISFGKDQIIYTNSFKHCCYYFKAQKLISSQALPFPFSEKLCKSLFRVKDQKYYWLQHGITKDKLNHKDMDYQYKEYSLVCCASDREVEFFKQEFGYNDDNAKCTGFCRFDGLIDESDNFNQILIMPTFRKWLAPNDINGRPNEKEKMNFLESSFYFNYTQLLTNKKLLTFLKQNKMKVVFYLHYAFQSYADLFKSIANEYIIIAAKKDYDVQELMKRSNIMVTDYSSVFFDFAYMKKPEAFFQFDSDEYRANHYKEGYFSYKVDAFGPVFNEVDEIVDFIIKSFEHGYKLENMYDVRIQGFFPLIDKNNCQRVYDSIMI